ncbi:MAG: hypothetical protein RL367_1538, partial [Pseudomonadota bacterium]
MLTIDDRHRHCKRNVNLALKLSAILDTDMTNDAQARFIEAAHQHGGLTREGDAGETNKADECLIAALRDLRNTPDKGEDFLAASLADDDLSVVTWAAL